MIGKIGANPLTQAIQNTQQRPPQTSEDPGLQAHVAQTVSHGGQVQAAAKSGAALSDNRGDTPQQNPNTQQTPTQNTQAPPTPPVADTPTANPQGQAKPAADETEPASNQNKPANTSSGNTETVNGRELEAAEVRVVEELKARDTEVRQHEQAHLAAAGQYAQGGPSYTFQQGPDGRRYAVGGEVKIDTSPVNGDPEATIQKANQIQAAALAPAEPSGQDRAVAAQAAQMAAQARQQLAEQRSSERQQSAEEAAEKRQERAASTQTEETGDSHSSQSNQRAIEAYSSTAANSTTPSKGTMFEQSA
jgi:hypothetical protein